MRTQLLTSALLGLALMHGCASPNAREREDQVNEPSSAPVTPPAPAPTSPPAPAPVTPARAAPSPEPAALVQLFPHVKIDRVAKRVEIDGLVPIDCHNPETPRVFLEVLVCTPDSKEHETLVMTKARAQQVHAALLAIGLTPGAPGRVEWVDRKPAMIAPTGAALKVRFRVEGTNDEIDPLAWVTLLRRGEAPRPLTTRTDGSPGADVGRFVFAGSRTRSMVDPQTGREREFYAADVDGTVVGLTTFGTETVAWSQVFSPESAVQEPEWIANVAAVPKVGTKVTVVLTAD